MKKCIYLQSDYDEYYHIKYFKFNQIYEFEKYEATGLKDVRYKIYHKLGNKKGGYSRIPDFLFHRLFKDIREYNLSRLLV
jgi:hypothetical protein